MGSDSAIQWTHHTFNPWRGCTHVSPGCEHCYAEALAKRNPAQLGTWGAGGSRVVAAESYWRQPERWNRAAEKAGERHRVFCASLADVFEDRPELVAPRERLWRLIVATPHLDWLLLTKRPENIGRLLGPRGINFYAVEGPVPCPQPNVWLGTTVEDQRRADERIPILLDTPAAVRFLSCEPLLGPVDVTRWLRDRRDQLARPRLERFHEEHSISFGEAADRALIDRALTGIDWVIVGGESGPRARPLDLAWARSLVDQCRNAGVPVFVKQLGRRPGESDGRKLIPISPTGLRHSHGGDIDEWPEDLQVREFPDVQAPGAYSVTSTPGSAGDE